MNLDEIIAEFKDKFDYLNKFYNGVLTLDTIKCKDDKYRQAKMHEMLSYTKNRRMLYSNQGCDEYLKLVEIEKFLRKQLNIKPYEISVKDAQLVSDLESFIVNKRGINFCSVNQIIIDRQDDGQLKEIKIVFKPE